MARIIQNWSGKDVLELVKWKEFVAIYFQSLIYNLFIVCKNVLWSLKSYFEGRFGSTRQHIAHKFPALSLMKSGDATASKNQQSVACPHQLMDAQLGQHKYMKLKVRKPSRGNQNRRSCDVRVLWYVTQSETYRNVIFGVCWLKERCFSWFHRRNFFSSIVDNKTSLRREWNWKRANSFAVTWVPRLLLRLAVPNTHPVTTPPSDCLGSERL